MGLRSALRGKKIYFDSNPLIYGFEQVEPWFSLAELVGSAVDEKDAFGVTSELTVMECLVKPFALKDNALVQRIFVISRGMAASE